MTAPAAPAVAERVRALVAEVADPEIPVLTIDDLGMLREVDVDAAGAVRVQVSPTYSGCPAMDTIRADIEQVLHEHGHDRVCVEFVLAPAWTTDQMSEAGRRKLEEYGIAPPGARGSGSGARGPDSGPVPLTLSVRCPHCGSADTRELSRFGSTACKSLWSCNACREPFDHFKSI